MKKLVFILLSSFFFLSCTKDSSEGGLSNDGQLNLTLNLINDFSLQLDQTTSKSNLLEDSDFQHVYNDEIKVTFTSDPPGYTQSLTFNPNSSDLQTIVLPYGEYNWEIPVDSNPTEISNTLSVYGQSTQTITINDPDINLSLDVNTDYALVTVNDDYTTNVTLTHEDLSISMNTKDGYNYGYVLSGTTSSSLSLIDTNGDSYTSDLGLIQSCKHYKYQLDYSNVGVNSLICLCDPFEVIERFLIPSNNIEVGDSVYGGIVFYLFEDGDTGYVEGETHGLIVALEDIGETRWLSGDTGNFKTDVTVTDYSDSIGGSDIGKGYNNCDNLVTYKNDNQLSGSFVAIELSISSELQNFQDWYLPSIGELTLIRNNTELRDAIGFTDGKYYWSSSLMDNKVGAMSLNMSVDSNGFCGCSFAEAYKVRPIRKF